MDLILKQIITACVNFLAFKMFIFAIKLVLEINSPLCSAWTKRANLALTKIQSKLIITKMKTKCKMVTIVNMWDKILFGNSY